MWSSSAAFDALLVAAAAQAQNMRPRDVDAIPSSPPTASVAYGSDPLQVGDLRLPAGKGPFPVVEVIRGGCWTKGYTTRQNTAALASALTAMGYATWNIEYRQIGGCGCRQARNVQRLGGRHRLSCRAGQDAAAGHQQRRRSRALGRSACSLVDRVAAEPAC